MKFWLPCISIIKCLNYCVKSHDCYFEDMKKYEYRLFPYKRDFEKIRSDFFVYRGSLWPKCQSIYFLNFLL